MFSRKFGVFSLISGVLCSLFFNYLKGINQPVRVTSALGSGYMTDGWGDAVGMFNFFIGAGAVIAILGLIIIIFPKKD